MKNIEIFPALTLGWLNGWILITIFFGSFGILLLTCSKEVISRLYDEGGWTKRHKIFSKFAKIFGFIICILLIFSQLNINSVEFFVGIVIFLFGTIGFLTALNTFKNSPFNKPITRGLYKISRNPQIVMMYLATLGMCLAISSWTSLIILALSFIFGHFRILGEEKRLTEQYGDFYLDYKKRVGRYFIFF